MFGNSVTFTGTLSNATLEAGESTAMCVDYPLDGGLVWWSWTATNTTSVVIDVTYAAVPNPIGFSVGDSRSVDGVNEFDRGYMDALTNRYIRFNAIAGMNYHIRVLGQEGSFTLRLTATNAPVIFRQPESLILNENESAMFGVMAGGFHRSHISGDSTAATCQDKPLRRW